MEPKAIRERAYAIIEDRDARDLVEGLIDEILGCAQRLDLIADSGLRYGRMYPGTAALYRRWAAEARAVAAGEEPDEVPDWFEVHDACSDERQARQEERDRYREEIGE